MMRTNTVLYNITHSNFQPCVRSCAATFIIVTMANSDQNSLPQLRGFTADKLTDSSALRKHQNDLLNRRFI